MSSAKQSKRIFLALTIMGLCLVLAIFSPITPGVGMGRGARVVGAIAACAVLAWFFLRTKAGQETGKDYQTGAKVTYEQAQEMVAKGKELVAKGVEEGYKLIAEGEALLKKIADEKKE